MFPMSQTTGYAIRALRCMDEPGGRPVLVEDIAEATGIPRSYLSKLVHRLAGHGLVVARRGHHGGVVLAKPAGSISLDLIAEAVEGGTPAQHHCFLGMVSCTGTPPCPLHAFWQETLQEGRRRLGGVSVRDLATHPDLGVERFLARHGQGRVQAAG